MQTQVLARWGTSAGRYDLQNLAFGRGVFLNKHVNLVLTKNELIVEPFLLCGMRSTVISIRYTPQD